MLPKKISGQSGKSGISIKRKSKKDIAIIGMCGQFSFTKNIDEFWKALCESRDCIHGFPEERFRDAAKMIPNSFMPEDPPRILEAGYLNEIDKFDHDFFQLSLSESKLIDPHQRLFLQAVWGALEDACYAGESIKGTNTGVFVGHSSDLMYEYFMYINKANPRAFEEISLPGNVRSIIASRISYTLDLKGPAMCIDTACSSALIAVHHACQSIIHHECDMAIAGGVNINHLPVQYDIDNEVGIRSPSNRAKTFDDSADGIGSGEGVGVVVLKPYYKAIEDRDNIYAIIKGSAVNHDGSSVGIVAPNRDRQEEVIVKAWKNADIDPETITYIEAHGTGTKLGDPIEVSAIENAFRNYTDKKSFCAVGSVKTNIGHLDNLAGIPGLIKTVLALKHKKIPPSIHFKKPNKQIDFISSPVYVNDTLSTWPGDTLPRRGGISSFGLSGTNCHMILEEHDAGQEKKRTGAAENESSHLFTLSAAKEEVLREYITHVKEYLRDHQTMDIGDICFSINTGRRHCQYRIAVRSTSTRDLLAKLETINGLPETGAGGDIYYGFFKIVPPAKHNKESFEITEGELQRLNNELRIVLEQETAPPARDIIAYYIKGADVPWDFYYNTYAKDKGYKRISLPLYPFHRTKCWVDIVSEPAGNLGFPGQRLSHPLLTGITSRSIDQDIYSTLFTVDDFPVLKDHRVADNYVLPGTAFIEIIREVMTSYYNEDLFVLRDIMFLTPLIVEEHETTELQTIIIKNEKGYEFKLVSRKSRGTGWNIHVQGSSAPLDGYVRKKRDLKTMLNTLGKSDKLEKVNFETSVVKIGKRWTSIKRELYEDGSTYLVYFDNSAGLFDDIDDYYLYPPLLDRCVNALNLILEGGSYIPLYYGELIISGPTPEKCYSLIQIKNNTPDRKESLKFNIQLCDTEGNVFVEIENYTIKKIDENEFNNKYIHGQNINYYEMKWQHAASSKVKSPESKIEASSFLVFTAGHELSRGIVEILTLHNHQCIRVRTGQGFKKIDEYSYETGNTREDFRKLFSSLKEKDISHIIHAASLDVPADIDSPPVFKESQDMILSLFHMTQGLLDEHYNTPLTITLVTLNANLVSGDEKQVIPLNNAFMNMGKVVEQEYPHFSVFCIDADEHVAPEALYHELGNPGRPFIRAFRNNRIYYEELTPSSLPVHAETPGFEVLPGGVYVVTGGLGALGFEISRHLLKKNNINLFILDRMPITPEHEQQGDVKKAGDKNNQKYVERFYALKNISDRVFYCPCDITDYQALEKVFHRIREQCAAINGIIHCAGFPGKGFIFNKNEKEFRDVLGPKVTGTWNIEKVTKDDNLDVLVLYSSITSVTAGPGQSDYTAANAFLDSFGQSRHHGNKRTVVINWPAWRETGMAFEFGIDEDENVMKSITTHDALAAFDTIMNRQVNRVIVGELNYQHIKKEKKRLYFRLHTHIEQELDHAVEIKPAKKENKAIKSVDLLLSGSDAAYSPTEKTVAGLWSEVLGLKEVNVYETFNSLGGDSLLAVRLFRLLDKEYPHVVDIADIFNYSTVNELADYIDKKLGKNMKDESSSGEDDIDTILDKLAKGELSVKDLS